MKKFFIALLALLPMLMIAQERHIAVIADPHVLAPQLMDTTSKSFKDMIQTQRKMLQLSAEAFDAVLDTCKRLKPDVVLIVGDLTKDGEKASHDYVIDKLNELRMEGIQIYVIPGNHDIGGKAYKYTGDEKEAVEVLDRDGWNSYFEEVMNPSSNDKIQRDDYSSFTFAVEPFDGLTILGIDGSDNDASTGRLKDVDFGFIGNKAEQARANNHLIIAMTHWQVLEHFDEQASLESSCRFENADELRDLLMDKGVHMLLTGHFHVNGITTYKDSTGVRPDSLVEVTTGSTITYPLPFRWLTVSEDRSTVTVQTRYLREPLDNHADVQAYSRDWMREHVLNIIPGLTLRGFSVAEQLIDTKGKEVLVQGGMSEQTAQLMITALKSALPQTDEEKIDLVQRHIGEPLVNLYLLHSDANEPQNPQAQAMADAFYQGMNNMMVEILTNNAALSWMYSMGQLDFIVQAPQIYAQPVVQSLVEDKTNRSSALHSDVTDDLFVKLILSEPFPGDQAIDDVEAGNTSCPRKQIRDGQLLIESGDKIFTVTGAETK